MKYFINKIFDFDIIVMLSVFLVSEIFMNLNRAMHGQNVLKIAKLTECVPVS